MPASLGGCLVALLLTTETFRPDTPQVSLEPRPLAPPPAQDTGAPEIHIQPGRAITLRFAQPLASESLSPRDSVHFDDVAVTSDTLVLLPTGSLNEDTRLWLDVRFAQGAVPAHTRLRLVVHAVGPDDEVRIRLASSPSSGPEAAQCLRPGTNPGGLDEVFSQGGVDPRGVKTQLRHTDSILRASDMPPVDSLLSLRASERVAVVVFIREQDLPLSRVPTHATVRATHGNEFAKATVSQEAPLREQSKVPIVVEVEARPDTLLGEYTVELRDRDGARLFTVPGVRFPQL
ncbi:DUF2381 family protein [Corallococcus sp. M34]|uniref:DUF2381 family protein n=1 Tax=Citreicoccus inhibens TaxID=2849499 RepID=UPI001C22D856|nr:DUF2381 family protein [Citreicoccus inhibens]MBU8896834.1 DUF2381 family protein [Citreicoccus inhibens]